MDLEAKPLQYFAAVARERSFSRAAQSLNVSQPALSAQVRELERRLGFSLFARTSRKVELTHEGRLFLREAQQMIAETARMRRAVREIRENELRVGAAIYSMMIPERLQLIDAFARAHPAIALSIDNREQARLFASLRRGDTDIAVVIGLAEVPSDGPLTAEGPPSEIILPSELERLALLSKPVELLVPRESLLADLPTIPRSALAGVRVAMLGSYHGGELIDAVAAPLEAAGAELFVPPEGNAIAVERYGQAMRVPAVSIGWFHYPEQADEADMIRRPVDGLDVRIELALLRAYRQSRPAAEAFWRFARDLFSKTGRPA